VREQASTMFHPVGTASMTARDAVSGVVDPDLKVKGVEGVRVVDASVFVRCLFFFLAR
jgi:choline dehydrogenase-like flavoprotein